mmetsp:Transcript_13651/g.34846  ORF Transcript_13651/g.34846 Transcript_13651/m.34846 type:complete len:232 (-) Transcript_13651:935-1630(-)
MDGPPGLPRHVLHRERLLGRRQPGHWLGQLGHVRRCQRPHLAAVERGDLRRRPHQGLRRRRVCGRRPRRRARGVSYDGRPRDGLHRRVALHHIRPGDLLDDRARANGHALHVPLRLPEHHRRRRRRLHHRHHRGCLPACRRHRSPHRRRCVRPERCPQNRVQHRLRHLRWRRVALPLQLGPLLARRRRLGIGEAAARIDVVGQQRRRHHRLRPQHGRVLDLLRNPYLVVRA